jgi:cyclopropane fatty-acyl-phospholipid synthase-like methyltransferase
VRLDLGSGQRPTEGFTGVDLVPAPGIVVADLFRTPWPFDSNSVDEVVCNHVVEHIPHDVGIPHVDGWWVFFAELYRMMVDGGLATFTHPHATSVGAFQDPTHTRYLNETSWAYLDRTWRTVSKVDHYGANVDFRILDMRGVDTDNEPGTLANLIVTVQVRKP